MVDAFRLLYVVWRHMVFRDDTTYHEWSQEAKRKAAEWVGFSSAPTKAGRRFKSRPAWLYPEFAKARIFTWIAPIMIFT